AVRAGVTTFTASLTGSIDIDAGNESGIFALSWNEKGSQQNFVFTPSTELGTTATGILTIKPLTFGAAAYGDDLTSDIAFDIVGAPVLSFEGPRWRPPERRRARRAHSLPPSPPCRPT